MGICAGEILYLHQTARPAPGAVGTVELEQATDTTIIRYAGFQRIIFFGAGLAEFLPDFEHPLHVGGLRLFQHRGDGFLSNAGNFRIAVRGHPSAIEQAAGWSWGYPARRAGEPQSSTDF